MRKLLPILVLISLITGVSYVPRTANANPQPGDMVVSIGPATNVSSNTNTNSSSDPEYFPYAPNISYSWGPGIGWSSGDTVDSVTVDFDGSYFATICSSATTACADTESRTYTLYIPTASVGQHSTRLTATSNSALGNRTFTSSTLNFWMDNAPVLSCTLNVTRASNGGSGSYDDPNYGGGSTGYRYVVQGMPSNVAIQNSDYTYDVPCGQNYTIYATSVLIFTGQFGQFIMDYSNGGGYLVDSVSTPSVHSGNSSAVDTYGHANFVSRSVVGSTTPMGQ